MKSVRKVASNKPPITTVASGRCTSAPSPLLNAIGKNPIDATKAVIKTGRNLIFPPMRTTSFKLEWNSFWRLNSAIKTIPLSTATPKSAMKPTPADILKFIPRSHNERIPPIAESGMVVKIISPYFTELNAK